MSRKKPTRQLIQKALFKTISQNLIHQFCENGISPLETIEFVNEILGELIIRISRDDLVSVNKVSEYTTTQENKDRSYVHTLKLLKVGQEINLNEYVFLRPLRIDDLAILKKWLGDPAIFASLAKHTLQSILTNIPLEFTNSDQPTLFVMCRVKDKRVIGLFGFTNIDLKINQGEFTKMIGEPSERKKGYARQATEMILAYGFKIMNLNRICLHTLDCNMKNINLNQSLGFRFEGLLQQAVMVNGQLRDMVVMALIKPDS